MKTKKSIHILAVLFAFCFLGTLSHAQINITVLETFNYPGGTATTSTAPQEIDDHGDVVGIFTDANSATFGFVRFANGTFSPLITEPNDTSDFTQGRGINNSRTICGNYIGSDGEVHAFFRVGGTFTEYDIPDATGTEVMGINNAGDFADSYVPNGGLEIPFISIGGTVTPIDIPTLIFGAADQINDANAVVGEYYDGSAIHGFYQDSTGALQFPIDPQGSGETLLRGINDQNWIVGTYYNDSGQHGLLFIPPGRFATFDYRTRTSLDGINRAGYICGSYFDAGLHETRGFIARATRTAEDEAELLRP